MRENEPPDVTGSGPAGAYPDPDDDRETIWGINRKDRPLFQVMTLVGGTASSVTLTILQLKYRAPDDTPDMLMLSILLGIGASFVAAGFASWGLLQIKELIMSIAYWIKERNARNRERLLAQGLERGREEGREEGLELGRAEGRVEGRNEGYYIGYSDAQQGNPQRPPSGNTDKSGTGGV